MIDVARLVEFELLSEGGGLWASVACTAAHGRWVVYANLRSSRADDIELADDADEAVAQPAFVESAEIIRRVLDNRLSARDWIAAVLRGERLSYTIGPDSGRAADVPARRPMSHPQNSAAAAPPAICAAMNAGAPAGAIPVNVSVNARAIVTAGFANEVDEVNQYAAPM
jgi:hypothetical protein